MKNGKYIQYSRIFHTFARVKISRRISLPIMRCCLKKHGAFLVNFVIDFANGDMSREEFDMDYSGYVIEHFPEFEREHPRLSRRFANTIERTYSTCSWMADDAFRDAIGDAVDAFLGNAPVADIY